MAIRKLLVTLDTFLDTRLGTIADHNTEAAEAILNNPEYILREHDDWSKLSGGLIDNETFDELYANRGGSNTIATLSASVVTGVIPLLLTLLSESNLAEIHNRTKGLSDLEICVDLHPYELDTDTKDELLNILKVYLGNETTITLTELGIEAASPSTLDVGYSGYISYDFNAWIKLHYLDLAKVRIPDFTFIGPKLFEKDVSELEPDIKRREVLRFKMEKMIYMNFEFVDTKCFSIIGK